MTLFSHCKYLTRNRKTICQANQHYLNGALDETPARFHPSQSSAILLKFLVHLLSCPPTHPFTLLWEDGLHRPSGISHLNSLAGPYAKFYSSPSTVSFASSFPWVLSQASPCPCALQSPSAVFFLFCSLSFPFSIPLLAHSSILNT